MKVCTSCSEGMLASHDSCPRCGMDLARAPRLTGRELQGMVLEGKYRLESFLEEGGMAWVYRGVHERLGSDIAIKLMKPAPDPRGQHDREQRFGQEATMASRLRHPHIISIIDTGKTAGGLQFIASELLDGVTLNVLLKQGPLPLGRVIRIFHQILAAVETAHSQNVIHRDLKPDNIMVLRYGAGEDFIKVLDFGIAKLHKQVSQSMTLHGEVFGTPCYMAPEQVQSGTFTTPRSDIYALGIILFELLTGRVPFLGATVQETLSKQLIAEAPAVTTLSQVGSLPEAFDTLLARALAKDPNKRHQSVAELRTGLMAAMEQLRTPIALACNSCHRVIRGPDDLCSDQCAHEHGSFFAPRLPTRSRTPWLPEGSDLATGPGQAMGQLPTAAPLTSRHTTSSPTAQRLAARVDEQDEVLRFLDGPGQVLEVIGATGRGRSTLLRAAARAARDRGWPVLEATPDPTLSNEPWYPVRRLVQQVLGIDREAGSPGLEALGNRLSEVGLARDDLPGLHSLLRPPALDRPDDALYSEKIYSALRVVLRSRQMQRSTCLLIDDLTEFDGASQLFVKMLCDAVEGTPIKVLIGAETAVLSSEGLHGSIVLEPLDLAQVRAVIEVRSPEQACDDALVERLAAISGGNPFHLDQALRTLDEGGLPPSPSLEAIINHRLGALPSAARHLLQAVSVMGQRAEAADIAPLFAPEEPPPEEARTLLAARGFLQRRSDDHLVITHSRFAAAAHGTIDPTACMELHRRALDLLEARGVSPITLSRHALEARQGERSLAICEQAGDLAHQLKDDQSAAMIHYRSAQQIARWELLLGVEDPRHLELSLKLSRSLRLAGHHLATEMVLKEALGAVQQQELQVQLLAELARLQRARSQLDLAAETIHRALKVAIPCGCPDLIVALYLELGGVLSDQDLDDRAAAELAEGVLLATMGGDDASSSSPPRDLWRLLATLTVLHHQRGDQGKALETAALALEQAEREGAVIGEAHCHLTLGRLLADQRQGQAAREQIELAHALYLELGSRQKVAECLLLQASLQPRQHAEQISRALTLSEQVGWIEGIEQAQRLGTAVNEALRT